MTPQSEFDAGRHYLDLAYQYADDVKNGAIVSCRYVQLAVERWFDDLENAHQRGWVFNENSAAEVFRFIHRYCKHYQGEWAGQPLDLSPWQAFIIANVFGWVSAETGYRRFRDVYEEIARKNGKTTKLAGVGSYLAAGDSEPGAKIYCAATKREQAREVFDSIAEMSKRDRTLARAMQPQRNEIRCNTRNSPSSKVLLLSKDYNSMDGFNVHAALVDELHAHPDSGIWDVLESGRGARRQPIMWGITTAGKNHNSFCYELREYAIKVLTGTVPKDRCDTFFAIIYTLDEDDDWTDERVWIKANPNLGVSVNLQDMRQQANKAKEVPTARIEFLTKRLNVWVYGDTTWMNMDRWNACQSLTINEQLYWAPGGASDLDNQPCYGGLDLASTEDMCAFGLVFTMPDGKTRTLARGYIPELAFDKRMQKGGILKGLYQKFRESGELVVTPGQTCDQEFIKHDILQSCARFNVKEIAFDRWNSSKLVTELMELELPMVAMGQGTASISAPMKELLRQVLQGNVEHNNALLSFAISNVVATVNPAGDIKYDKSKVTEKIDPAVAIIMALGRSMVPQDQTAAAVDDFIRNPITL